MKEKYYESNQSCDKIFHRFFAIYFFYYHILFQICLYMLTQFVFYVILILVQFCPIILLNRKKEVNNEIKYKKKNSEELYTHIIARLDELNNEIKSLKNS